MGEQILKEELLEKGYVVVKQAIAPLMAISINNKHKELIPSRGHAVDNKYWPKDKIAECPELALWWSQQLTDWFEVQQISRQLMSVVGHLFQDPQVYVADVITNTPKNQYIKPHIDSPYRFDEWHDNFDLLGVQCIVPLCKFTKQNGGTGVLPGSHKRNWVVKDSYKGVYNEEFLAGVVQPQMDVGDALIYFPRLLHSTMPNTTAADRRALLIHITEKSMIERLKQVDNIWLE